MLQKPRLWLLVAIVALGTMAGTPVAVAAGRVALVIGNGAYQKVPRLPNPPNDASDVGASLERLGFSVRRLTDATFDNMRRAFIEFGRETTGSEIALIFFAGHGIE